MPELRSGGQVDSVSSNVTRQITNGHFGDSYHVECGACGEGICGCPILKSRFLRF